MTVTRGRTRARGGAPDHQVTSRQDTQQQAAAPLDDDDAARALERLTRAGWTTTQLAKLDLNGDLERAIAWLDHAENGRRVRNPGGLAWSGYDSNVWPPEQRRAVAVGATGERSITTVNEYVCPQCGPPGYTTEAQLIDHVERIHDTTSPNGDHAEELEPVVDVDLKSP